MVSENRGIQWRRPAAWCPSVDVYTLIEERLHSIHITVVVTGMPAGVDQSVGFISHVSVILLEETHHFRRETSDAMTPITASSVGPSVSRHQTHRLY